MLKPEEVNCVIAHKNCPDGFGAAWSVWTKHGNNIEYHFDGYKEKIYEEDIPDVTGKNVLMVDFAYQDVDVMNRLNAKANKMLLLDHHEKTRDLLEGNIDCDHIFDMDRSGARMAWDYFYPKAEPSTLIQYIEDRDIWKWELPNAREYLAALDSYPQTFENFTWIDGFSKREIADFIAQGSSILRYHNILVKKSVRTAVPGDLLTPDGERHPCYIVNHPSKDLVSDIGNVLAHDDVIAFVWCYSHHNEINVASLRSVGDKSVSDIASLFGGGGHKNASGCSFKTPINEIFEPYEKEKAEPYLKRIKDIGF